MKIRPVNRQNGNRYCGPAAISALTGCTTDDAATVIRSISGQTFVKGAETGHVCQALEAFGLRVNRVTGRGEFLINVARRKGVFLVVYDNHFAVVGSGMHVCARFPVPVAVEGETPAKLNLRAKVQRVYAVAGKLTVKTPDALVAREKTLKHRAAQSTVRRQCLDLAKRHGIRVVDEMADYEQVWVCPPEGLYVDEENDPYDGNHIVDTWPEALERVKEYAAIIEEWRGMR